MSPHRLARCQVVAGDDFVVTALLLRVEEVAENREGRPTRSDGPAPQLDRRRLGPVDLDPYVADDAVAIGAAKPGQSAVVSVAARDKGGAVGSSPARVLLGSLRPPPRKIVTGFDRKTPGPEQSPDAARKENGARPWSRAVVCRRGDEWLPPKRRKRGSELGSRRREHYPIIAVAIDS